MLYDMEAVRHLRPLRGSGLLRPDPADTQKVLNENKSSTLLGDSVHLYLGRPDRSGFIHLFGSSDTSCSTQWPTINLQKYPDFFCFADYPFRIFLLSLRLEP